MPDVLALLRRLLAHWPMIVATLALGGLVTGVIVRNRRPAYKSETVIFFREGISKSVTGNSEGSDVLRTLGSKLKETLLAQQNLRTIIDEFHLYKEVVDSRGYSDAVDLMRRKTEFKSRSPDTFAIAFEGTSREEAQEVCARMASLLVGEHAKRMKDDIRGTTDFLSAEKKHSDDDLVVLEKEVSEFLNAHPEFAGKDALGTESLVERAKVVEEEKLRRQRTALGAHARPRPEVPASPAGASDRAPAVDPVLLAAKAQAAADLSAARKDLAEKSRTFTDQHPDVQAAMAKAAQAEAVFRRADEAVQASQPTEAPVLPVSPVDLAAPKPAPQEPREATAAPKATDAEHNAVSLETEWSRLSRAIALARTKQSDLAQKLYRAEMVASTAESGHGTTIAVLDPAYRPSGPSNAPNKTVVVLGLALSIAVGVLLAAVWGIFLDDRVFAASEIEASVMVSVVGIIPRAKRTPVVPQGPAEKAKG